MILLYWFADFKGCVQGYGNYNQLTSSGLNPTELFDDIEDNSSSGKPSQVAVLQDDLEEDMTKPENKNLIPVKKARRHFKSGQSESDPNSLKLEEVSLHAASSLFSLISLHDDIREFETEVRTYVSCIWKMWEWGNLVNLNHTTKLK